MGKRKIQGFNQQKAKHLCEQNHMEQRKSINRIEKKTDVSYEARGDVKSRNRKSMISDLTFSLP